VLIHPTVKIRTSVDNAALNLQVLWAISPIVTHAQFGKCRVRQACVVSRLSGAQILDLGIQRLSVLFILHLLVPPGSIA
jgi:hypothetical protein